MGGERWEGFVVHVWRYQPGVCVRARSLARCRICLLEYDVGDQQRRLPCLHQFHSDCVDTWLKDNATCPVCRHPVD